MKKIAIIASGHMASTLPYIKRLVEKNIKVDYYVFSAKILFIEGLDGIFENVASGVNIVSYNNFPSVYDYINSENFKLYTIKMPRPFKSVFLLRNILSFIRFFYFRSLINYLCKVGYDRIHLVGRYNSDEFKYLIRNINNDILSLDLHEVCNHFQKDFNHPNDFLQLVAKSKISVVVHSKNVANDIMSYGIFDKSQINIIPFGLFETFKTIPSSNYFELPTNFILYYGSINPYKGLDVLYNSIQKIKDKINDVKIVVAGYGNIEVLEKIKNDDKFICINKFLSNKELVELIEKSRFVICPYKTISQSGIPQTVYNFDKPIIASDLMPFRDVIDNYKNGLLFPVGDDSKLSNCILYLIDENNYNLLKKEFSKIWKQKSEFDWNSITEQYISLFFN